MTHLASEPPPSPSSITYVGAGSEAAPRCHVTRTADRQAAFFLPYLRPGMNLLDCGCGPGSITQGLATAVAPGEVVGIDSDPRQIERARTQGAGQQVPNLRFETADIYALPFPDGSFDAVFSNAVWMYLSDPPAALREMHRVLKAGGVVGIRDPDWDGQLLVPPDPVLMRFWQIFGVVVQRKGGTPYRGKYLRASLHQAGFVQVQASASYDCFGTTDATRQMATTLSDVLREAAYIQQVVELGLAERAELECIGQAWQQWGEKPEAFTAHAYCEVVGWKA